jgi:FKBP-type peptidyl-prolyl cis-trans isomerase
MFNKCKQSVGYVWLIGISILFACQNDPLDIDGGGSTDDLEKYLQENNVTATKAPEGYYFEPIQTNENGLSVENGNIVTIYYSVTTLSGTVIDEHLLADGSPVKLQHGVDAVWPVGIDLGLGKMKEGEVYRFYIPSALAYQEVPSEGFQASSSVFAEVEVREVLNKNGQQLIDNQAIEDFIVKEKLNNVRQLASGLRIHALVQGNGNMPDNGQEVTFSYTAKFIDNTLFSTGSETVSLGDNTLIEGLEEGRRNMTYGEKALLIIPSDLGYGASVGVIPFRIISSLINSKIIPAYTEKVLPFKVLVFEVTLQP